jgi:hypothetical protein
MKREEISIRQGAHLSIKLLERGGFACRIKPL